MKADPRIAFVIEALPSIGGGEKTLFAALECFPRADVFTLIYKKEKFLNTPLQNRKVITSHLDQFPLARRHHRLLMPLMPHAIEQFDLRRYDVVVSFHYAVANGVNTNGAKHFSYTFTPMRYAWNAVSIDGINSHNQYLINRYLQSFRQWDQTAASRVDEFAAVSREVARRIRSAYQRDARVIYPPVEMERFHPSDQREKYYVALSRLVAHKRIDLIIEAFSRLRLPLKIIGDGPVRKNLQRRSAPNIAFLGFQSDQRVADLLGSARGFVCAAEEDFGIAIVEAQSAGCPVIAYQKGGAQEIVIEGQTGLFFKEQNTECLMEAVERFERQPDVFPVQEMMKNARRFSKERFQTEFKSSVEDTSQSRYACPRKVSAQDAESMAELNEF